MPHAAFAQVVRSIIDHNAKFPRLSPILPFSAIDRSSPPSSITGSR
jgi:hypothetical protein